jgi:uncharacterized protein (TIGR02996 family)
MSQEEAFLRAIVEAPDDDLPRLACADWLEEQGDPRGEFIHVQIEMSRLPVHDPRWADLRRREQELLDQHAWGWAEPLGERVQEWVFRRGFIEQVRTSLEAPASSLRDLLQRAPIRHLRDTGQFCDFRGLVQALPHLKQLTGLEFWGLYAFDDELLRRLLVSPHLRNLRTLILHHDRNGNLADDGVVIEGVLSDCRENIEELAVNVDGCWRGPSARVVRALTQAPLKNLRRLTLSHAELEADAVDRLARSRRLPRLNQLDLGSCQLTRAGWAAVARLVERRRLTWLRLSDADVVDAEGEYVAAVAETPHLQQAFEEAVEVVDWDSPFISPYDEGCWSGHSWDGRRRAVLFDMNRYLRAGDLRGLEVAYRASCVAAAHGKEAAEIDALRFDAYEERLRPGFEQALANLGNPAGRAIVYRMRPDIEWKGCYHIPADEMPDTKEPFEEFSHGPSLQFPGASFAGAAEVYARHPLAAGVRPAWPALYLLARTVVAFARAARRYQVPVPLYWSCMYAVFRI